MIVDVDSIWVIEASDGNLQSIGENVFVHAERTSTDVAETPFSRLGRAKAIGLSSEPCERLAREVHKREHRRARMPPAYRAVTNNAAKRGCRGPVADRAT